MSRNILNFAVAFLVCILIFSGQALAGEKPVGKVIAIIGSAEYLPGGSEPLARIGSGQVRPVSIPAWQKIQPQQLIYPQDEFRTGRKSRMRILFEDRSLMALGPNTQLKISSYIYDPAYNLRQGVINMAHGLSMYIVNKEQVHPDSHFKIVTPAANMAARGTQGYLSVSQLKTLVANQAGFIRVLNVDPTILGDVIVGPMMKTVIEEGAPPTPPETLTEAEKNLIQQVIMGWTGSRYREKPRKGSSVGEALKEEYDLFDEDNSDPCSSG